jgi:hypothetical protein
MFTKNRKKSMIAVLAVLTFLTFILSANSVLAGSGSISAALTYPENGGTYAVVDNFTYQMRAVNINTTYSVSVDGRSPIPMNYQGIITEVSTNASIAGDWYQWQLTVPAITTPGTHTFQFFGHYYVWQDADHYWAEFTSSSTIRSFTIASSYQRNPNQPSIKPTSNNIFTPFTLPLWPHLYLSSYLISKSWWKLGF